LLWVVYASSGALAVARKRALCGARLLDWSPRSAGRAGGRSACCATWSGDTIGCRLRGQVLGFQPEMRADAPTPSAKNVRDRNDARHGCGQDRDRAPPAGHPHPTRL